MTTIRSRKAKGSRFQREVATLIRDRFNLQDRQCVSTPASCTGEDILMTENTKRLFPFSIECKARENINIWDALDQAKSNTNDERFPLVVFKRNRSKVYCAMEFDDLLEIFQEIARNESV